MRDVALALVGGLSIPSCGGAREIEPATPETTPRAAEAPAESPVGELARPEVAIPENNCDTERGYELDRYVAKNIGERELYVVNLYESRSEKQDVVAPKGVPREEVRGLPVA